MAAACAPTPATGQPLPLTGEQTRDAVISTSVRMPSPATPQVVFPTAAPVPTRPPIDPDQPAAVQVQVIDDAFRPDAASAHAGEVVEWRHAGFRLHTVTGFDRTWNSGAFVPGDTFRMSFAQPGVYQYFCVEHPWMIGYVVVTTE